MDLQFKKRLMEMEEEAFKDISDLKKELEGMKGRKEFSAKELYDAVQKLDQTIGDMLDVFGAAAEQMRLEEQSYEASAKKHEAIISKLDKLIDQNKTIAEGMVAIVEMVKERIVAPAKEEVFRPRMEPKPLFKPQPEWQPKPEPIQRTQPMMAPQQFTPQMPPQMAQPMGAPDFGMPPMQPTPPPDLDFPDLDLGMEEEPRKKGLFGMFKK